jgi:hypothetical protein
MTQGFPPATATTMIVIKEMINDTPVIGGMSASFRVVFLVIRLLILLEFLSTEFLSEMFLSSIVVLLWEEEEPALPKLLRSRQSLRVADRLRGTVG